MTTTPTTTTQQKHPWRAAARTGLAVLVGAASTTPFVVQILDEQLSGWEAAGIGGQTIAVAGIITRIMALPAVDRALEHIGLASAPRPNPAQGGG